MKQRESIVVCVVYGEHGVRLFDRAAGLAQKLDAVLTLVVLDPRSEDFDGDRLLDIPLFEELVERAGGILHHVRRPVEELVPVLTEIGSRVNATQIVMAQRAESMWSMMFESTFVESLLRAVPSADLHLVSEANARDDDEWDYEPAVHAYLAPRNMDDAVIRFGDAPPGALEGLFCRRSDTDFTTGIFVLHQEGQVHGLPVQGGHIDLDTMPFHWPSA
ncbi:hypothetical protein [Rhodococcoides fascians]|uniref:hypothetical protein n=1 Tax=Rhodococcoides fascians TaxID=1828 RepID=UPI000B2D9304|nr:MULTISPECIES: hypothetical protein [Rhodococcus]